MPSKAPSEPSPSETPQSQPATKVVTESNQNSAVKDQFRQALERKRGQSSDAQGGGPAGGNKILGAHGKAGNKRQFRRKSGG